MAAKTSSSKDKRRVEAEKAALKIREKETLDRQQNALRRQQEFRDKTLVWNEHILPKWNDISSSIKVRELCHKGIPPNIRGKVWPLLIKNDLQVTFLFYCRHVSFNDNFNIYLKILSQINAEIFEHLNRKVVQLYGSNFSASRYPFNEITLKKLAN